MTGAAWRPRTSGAPRKRHPDVRQETDAQGRLKEPGEACEVFEDPQKRQAGDQPGQRWKHAQEFRPPAGSSGIGAGIALVPDLLDQIDQLLSRLSLFESEI